MKFYKNRKCSLSYYFFLVIMYLFIFMNYIETIFPIFGYFDELLAIIAIPIFLINLYKNEWKLSFEKKGYSKYILLYALFGISGNLIYNYQSFLSVALPDMFLSIKFWLVIYVGKYIFKNLQFERYKIYIMSHVKSITLLLASLVLIDNIINIFPAGIRYGIRSTQLFYGHPTGFAAICVFLVIILIATSTENKNALLYNITLLFLMCSTLRSKAIGVAFAFVLVYYFSFYKKKKVRLRTLILFIPLLIFLGWDQIEFYFFSSIISDSARYQLLVNSFKIAKDHFPLGSGFGTFASYYSGVHYSPLYEMYGISNVYGLREGATAFVSDSYWPMVLAQTGWLGLSVMVMSLVFIFLKIQKLREVSLFYYVSGLCILIHLIISSTAESAFVHPISIPLGLWLGFLFSKVEK